MTVYSLDVLLFLFGTSLWFHLHFCCFLTAYRFLRRQIRCSGIPILFRIVHSLLWSTQSKALAWSIKQKYMFFSNSLAFLMIQRMLAIWSLAPYTSLVLGNEDDRNLHSSCRYRWKVWKETSKCVFMVISFSYCPLFYKSYNNHVEM